MSDAIERARAESRRLQDQHERAQYEVLERLWDTEQALSNRVRIFAVGVLAVSWGLLVQETGSDASGVFDLAIVFIAALLSIAALFFDFLYFQFRRTTLAHAARRGTRALNGSGPMVPFLNAAGTLRAIFFFSAIGALVYAAVSGLAPVILEGAPLTE